MVGERVTIMNILDLKRQLLALRGFCMPSESDGGNGSTGTSGATSAARGGNGGNSGGFGMFGAVSYADPSLSDMTNTPTSGLSDADKATVAKVRDAVDRGEISRDALNRALSKTPAAAKAAISVMGALLAGNLGTAAAAAINKALDSKDPMESMRSLASEAEASGNLAASDNAFNSTGNDGGNSSDASGSSTTGSDGATAATSTTSTGTTSSNQDPATLATSIANQSWNDWQGDKTALQDQVATNTARGNALYDTATNAANQNMSLVTGMQDDYNNIYRPAGQQYANYVNMLGSKEYQDQQVGRATADVQQKSDAQMQAAQRNLQRSGVDPSSGRMASMASQNAIGTAAAQAGAANTSRRNTLSDWSTGLTKMADMGNATLNSAKGLDSSAQSWNTLGLNAGNTGFNQSSDLSKLSALNTSTSGGVAGTAANAIYNQGQLANSNSANQRANDAANPWTTIGGAIITDAAKGIDWGSLFS